MEYPYIIEILLLILNYSFILLIFQIFYIQLIIIQLRIHIYVLMRVNLRLIQNRILAL